MPAVSQPVDFVKQSQTEKVQPERDCVYHAIYDTDDEVITVREFLSPLWEFLFEKFGVFGILIATALPLIAVGLALLIVVMLISFVAKLFSKNKPAPSGKKTVSHSNSDPEALYQKAETLAERSLADLPEAMRYYLQAAQLEHIPAQAVAGRMYYYGITGYHDKEKGLYWLKKAAKSGNIYARIVLGRIHEKDMRYQDPGEVLDWLIPVAEQGDPEAQYLLSRLYSQKQEWREKQKGYTAGQWKEDELCLQWYRQSKHWLKQAAENHWEEAMDLYY